MFLDNSTVLTEGGYFVSEKMERLSRILMDYDPQLSAKRLAMAKAETAENEAPYRLVHRPNDRQSYVVMFIYENDNPETILARIIAGDNWNHRDGQPNALARLDAQNSSAELFKLKKHADDLEEAADKFHFLFTRRSKNYVNLIDEKTGQKYKLDSDRRRRNK